MFVTFLSFLIHSNNNNNNNKILRINHFQQDEASKLRLKGRGCWIWKNDESKGKMNGWIGAWQQNFFTTNGGKEGHKAEQVISRAFIRYGRVLASGKLLFMKMFEWMHFLIIIYNNTKIPDAITDFYLTKAGIETQDTKL